MTRRRVLVVAMADSIHTARWLAQFRDEAIDVELFPSSPHRRVHPLVQDLERSTGPLRLTVTRSMRHAALPLALLDTIAGNRLRAIVLRRRVARFDPDLVHVVEIQHAGYVALAAKTALADRRVIVTNWGSDIFWFQHMPRHRRRIERVLALASDYSAECERDHTLARQLGFRGRRLPLIPNAGGLASPAPDGRQTSSRHAVIIKGYSGFVGRAVDVLRLLPQLGEDLRDREVVVYSADLKTRVVASWIQRRNGIRMSIHPKHALTHDEVLDLMSAARVYVGYSRSDAISTSMLEAMSQGAYPIQTTTSCAEEWVEHGVSGSLVSFGDHAALVQEMRRALRDDALVDHAAEVNAGVCRTRLDPAHVARIARTFYEPVSSHSLTPR